MRKLKNEELNRLSTEEYKEAEKMPVILVLDNIRSLHNVGSAFRTGDAFRIEKILLCGITATPPHREINKTALGATETVDWEYIESIDLAIENLKKQGYEVCAIEQADKSTSLEEFNPSSQNKYAYIFGNEVFGVNESAIQVSDRVLEIPQFGTKHSINVTVCMGIVLWNHFKSQT